jgi:hypothetical protein
MEKTKVIDITVPNIKNTALYYITIWNGMLGLRDSESKLFIKIVEKYLELQGDFSNQIDLFEKLFSSRIRKEIREELSISEHVFNTRLMYLKKKNVIKQDKEGIYSIDGRFIPSTELVFRFKIK